jgi:hypothetical protein
MLSNFTVMQRSLVFIASLVVGQTLIISAAKADEPIIDASSTSISSATARSKPVTPIKKSNFNSAGLLAIDSLNQQPKQLGIVTQTGAISSAISNSFVRSESLSDIKFLSEPTFSNPLECNFGDLSLNLTGTASCNQSIAQVRARGNDYAAYTNGSGVLQGNFLVDAGDTFSFNFLAILDLKNNLNSSLPREFYNFGEIAFSLYDFVSGNLLDSFSLSANLDTHGSQDFLRVSQPNQNITFATETYLPAFSLGTGKESVYTEIEGSYSRKFARQTHLVLIATNNNQVAATPESSSIFALLFFLGAIIVRNRQQRAGRSRQEALSL